MNSRMFQCYNPPPPSLTKPILAASCLPFKACNLFDRANSTNRDIAANKALHATNSQKSSRSFSGIRPHDSQAGVSPWMVFGLEGGGRVCPVGGGGGWVEVDDVCVQCMRRRLPNGLQNGSWSYSMKLQLRVYNC